MDVPGVLTLEPAVRASGQRGSTRNGVSCGTCAQSWSGLSVAHCGADGCHQTFSAVGLFDKHRVHHGEHGRCIPPEEIAGMEFRNGMWRGPEMDEAAKEKRFGKK